MPWVETDRTLTGGYEGGGWVPWVWRQAYVISQTLAPVGGELLDARTVTLSWDFDQDVDPGWDWHDPGNEPSYSVPTDLGVEYQHHPWPEFYDETGNTPDGEDLHKIGLYYTVTGQFGPFVSEEVSNFLFRGDNRHDPSQTHEIVVPPDATTVFIRASLQLPSGNGVFNGPNLARAPRLLVPYRYFDPETPDPLPAPEEKVRMGQPDYAVHRFKMRP